MVWQNQRRTGSASGAPTVNHVELLNMVQPFSRLRRQLPLHRGACGRIWNPPLPLYSAYQNLFAEHCSGRTKGRPYGEPHGIVEHGATLQSPSATAPLTQGSLREDMESSPTAIFRCIVFCFRNITKKKPPNRGFLEMTVSII